MECPKPFREFRVDQLTVKVFEDRRALGLAAAIEAGRRIAEIQAKRDLARVIFAAAPSQNEFLEALAADRAIDWSRVLGLHMDEYLGIGPDHPASFRRFLMEHLFGPANVPALRLRLIPAERKDSPLRVCLDYEEALRADPPDLVCAGIGENGHLAFNDPPVADFLDPVLVKVVRLDAACRTQQVHDGCFARIEDVPTHAYTLTIPALLSAPALFVMVPGSRKAEAVRDTLEGPVGESCPASALRTNGGATLYLDRESASLLG